MMVWYFKSRLNHYKLFSNLFYFLASKVLIATLKIKYLKIWRQ